MPAPLPIELRDRFARYITDGLSGREAAQGCAFPQQLGVVGRVKFGREA